MSIDADLNRLYQLPPHEFIPERNALSKRAGGRSQEIRGLPKPPLAIWAVNQLHWRKPDVYSRLIDAAENLRATNKAVLAGRPGDLRTAGKAHEEAHEAALKAALAIVSETGHPPSDATRQTIATTLRALPADDPPGRLRQALAPAGFEMLAGLPSAGRVLRPPPRTPPRSSPQKPAAKRDLSHTAGKPKVDSAATARARKAAASAARTLAEAEQAARREEFEAARAARDGEKAERRVARAQVAVDTAEAELREAEREAAAAAKKREGARARAHAADQALEAARARAEAARRELGKLDERG